MKSTTAYFTSFFLIFIILALIAMRFAPKDPVAKFSLPSFNSVFISSYGDHDAIHRIIYQGLFGFGKKIANADVLIIGNSHAELGLSAEQISQALSAQNHRRVKVVNLGMGWGEAFPFAKKTLKNLHLECKVLLLDLYATLSDRVTDIGRPILTESKMTSYSKVIEAWAITLKDWLFDGIFPRITFAENQFTLNRFLAYPVGFRRWENGDVLDYWLPNAGEIYRNTPSAFISYPLITALHAQGNMTEVSKVLDRPYLDAHNLKIISTLIPSNDIDREFYVGPIKQLGLPFIAISFNGIELYDKYHADSKGRALITARLMNASNNSSMMQSIQALNTCRG